MPPALETWLPLFNTSLILVSGIFLLAGYVLIRRKRVLWHRRAMLTAVTFAALFLVVYVTRAVLLPTKLFPGDGNLRVLYFAVLISHTIVSIVVGPLALVTLRRALTGRFEQHRKIARVTLPMWLYTAVTGWMVYWMLHGLA